ncbi:hypothetical protein C0J52_08310 [Blattella germanica]|nr:hypothetical protein C0J52_08310 [Blattella germanica]
MCCTPATTSAADFPRRLLLLHQPLNSCVPHEPTMLHCSALEFLELLNCYSCPYLAALEGPGLATSDRLLSTLETRTCDLQSVVLLKCVPSRPTGFGLDLPEFPADVAV